MADRLDAMTVGIHHEGAVIVSVIMRSERRRAIVVTSGGKSCDMKGVDGRSVGSAKTQMHTGSGRPHIGFVGDGKLYPERARCRTEPRPLPKSTMRTSPSGRSVAS